MPEETVSEQQNSTVALREKSNIAEFATVIMVITRYIFQWQMIYDLNINWNWKHYYTN